VASTPTIRGPKPSERAAKAVLEHLWPDATVSHYDDGTTASMYDLRVTGPFEGAAEVGEITDAVIRKAHGHWNRHLRGRTTVALQRYWTFMFKQLLTDDAESSRYPRQPRPDAERIEAVLARLEERRITSLDRLDEYCEFSWEGRRWTDPDVRELFELVGAAADGASSVPAPQGKPGGWRFFIARHHSGRPDADALRSEIEGFLNGAALGDLRDKLKASAAEQRIAVLVYDSTTSTGWSLVHWGLEQVPENPLALPTEITTIVVVGLNGFVLVFDAAQGWRRCDVDVGGQRRSTV
jgi:hypothetical protein